MSDDRYIDNAVTWAAGCVAHYAETIGQECESPIERGMLIGLIGLWLVDRRIRFPTMITAGPLLTEWEARVYPQHSVGKYRVDFAIHITRDSDVSEWIAIECDGHNYHERTKEQAQRDKARDRELSSAGFTVLRFTGSEIYRDNMACAHEVHELILKLGERDK